MSAIYYTADYCVQASIPNLFLAIYGFNELEIGVSYTSIGIGVAAGGCLHQRQISRHQLPGLSKKR